MIMLLERNVVLFVYAIYRKIRKFLSQQNLTVMTLVTVRIYSNVKHHLVTRKPETEADCIIKHKCLTVLQLINNGPTAINK